jgi:drug/metabolite transporter (DMT)-like permease
VAVAMVGTYMLSLAGKGLALQSGELKGVGLVFIGSIFWAIQILCLEKFGSSLDSIKLSCIEFTTCAALSGIPMLLIEQPSGGDLMVALGPILYCGVLSVGVAFTAQVVCIKHVDAIVATLIMSLESVFAALFGFVLLGEVLTFTQLLGCALVLGAVVISEMLPRLTKTE